MPEVVFSVEEHCPLFGFLLSRSINVERKMKIHPTAVVDPDASLDSSVRVGPYTVIEKNVHIGPDTEIGSHSIISGPTTIGARNRIGSFASIGAPPQDIHYQDEPTRLEIGDDNWIREYTSLHRGSPGGRGVTRTRAPLGGQGTWVPHNDQGLAVARGQRRRASGTSLK